MRATASPSDTPGGRLNESVTAGSWPSWLMVSDPAVRSTRAKAPIGTSLPSLLRMRTSGSSAVVQLALSLNSMTTEKLSPVP